MLLLLGNWQQGRSPGGNPAPITPTTSGEKAQWRRVHDCMDTGHFVQLATWSVDVRASFSLANLGVFFVFRDLWALVFSAVIESCTARALHRCPTQQNLDFGSHTPHWCKCHETHEKSTLGQVGFAGLGTAREEVSGNSSRTCLQTPRRRSSGCLAKYTRLELTQCFLRHIISRQILECGSRLIKFQKHCSER